MFTILGGDGKEYGPATLAQIQAWITAGRANLDTRAKLPGDTEWRRLGDIPEFNGTAEPGVPPPLGGEAVVTEELLPAGRGTRLLAVVIDRLLSALIALPGLLLLGPVFLRAIIDSMQGRTPDFSGMELGSMLIGIAVLGFGSLALGIIQIVMISRSGQSIGKRILGVKIVRFSTGGPAGFVHGWLIRAVVPALISALPWIGFVFLIVNYCFIFREDRRCLHDLMADTRVVNV